MCRFRPSSDDSLSSNANEVNANHSAPQTKTITSSLLPPSIQPLISAIFPLPLPLALTLLPFLPTSSYLNRGYTVWFHLFSLTYLLTRNSFLRKILILQGTGICLGWYAAIVNEWYCDGMFCHTLYRNMPEGMIRYMIQQLPVDDAATTTVIAAEGSGGYIFLDTYSAYAMIALSHVLDTLGHPILAYAFYRIHMSNGGTIRDILTWPVVVSAWHISRVWSLVHSYYNTGVFSLWYVGHDVYVLNNLDSYVVAYVWEGMLFGGVAFWKLFLENDRTVDATKTKKEEFASVLWNEFARCEGR
mmetsp:Transcript_10435/g.22974  ORF Transcript_10435/g.22974 Transcript_10435/m.22974 type:complete len:301 (-) Transcript_10435:160-1062(-)